MKGIEKKMALQAQLNHKGRLDCFIFPLTHWIKSYLLKSVPYSLLQAKFVLYIFKFPLLRKRPLKVTSSLMFKKRQNLGYKLLACLFKACFYFV